MEFLGTFAPATLAANTSANLYMASGNKLKYPTQEGHQVNAQRAYFKIEGMSAGAKTFSNIILNFEDVSEATGIEVKTNAFL